MKCVVSGPGGPSFVERPEPNLSESEALIRVRAALVTPADVLSGRRPPEAPVQILGQSFVGSVERVGAQTPAAKAFVGRRVAVHPVVRCGRCDRCLGGLSAHCRERRIIGLSIGGQGRDGGFASFAAVPLANLAPLPDSLDDERAVFATVVGEALEAARQVRVDGKAFITVLGDDLVALVMAQVMTRLNAAVRVIARQQTTLALAEKLGVKHRHADEIGRRGDQDVVVDCVGTAESLAFASALVRARGTVLLKSLSGLQGSASGGTADLSPIVLGELTVQGSLYGPLPEAIELLGKRAVEVVSLIDRRVALEAALPLRAATLVRCV